MWVVLRHTFGVNKQVSKAALRNLEDSLGWTAMVSTPDYEEDYKPNRVLKFPSPYSK